MPHVRASAPELAGKVWAGCVTGLVVTLERFSLDPHLLTVVIDVCERELEELSDELLRSRSLPVAVRPVTSAWLSRGERERRGYDCLDGGVHPVPAKVPNAGRGQVQRLQRPIATTIATPIGVGVAGNENGRAQYDPGPRRQVTPHRPTLPPEWSRHTAGCRLICSTVALNRR